jgi:predicted HTH transcriptional regulator
MYLFSSEIMDRTAFSAGGLYKPIITPNRSHEINQFSISMSKISSSKIQDRIKEFEHQQMERKSSFKYDMNTGGPSEEREVDISKAIAGFMNASGGILYVGVDKDGNASGLDMDYTFVKNKNQDGFELELRNSIRKYLKITDDLYRIRFHKISETDICEVMVRPSFMPVLLYHKDKISFFVRQGNSTQPLGLAEILNHCQRHFWSYNIQI